LRALIVDDERLARSELRRLLAVHPEIEIVGEARDAEDAREHIERLRPDLLFLDIQMPGRTGFELLEKLEILPLVVFTTAYDEHALKAFEVNALDYLLKPIVPERLAAAVSRAVQETKVPAAPISADQKIFVRDGERCWFVPLRAIALFESEGNYTRVYFDTNRPLVLRSLNALESRLDRTLFYRCSRRHIVNLQSITAIKPSISGGLILTLEGKRAVEMSRRRTARFRELMSL
jgi:two-component system LytT family response regulator